MMDYNVLVLHGGMSRIYLSQLHRVLVAKAGEGTLEVGVPNALLAVMAKARRKLLRQSRGVVATRHTLPKRKSLRLHA